MASTWSHSETNAKTIFWGTKGISTTCTWRLGLCNKGSVERFLPWSCLGGHRSPGLASSLKNIHVLSHGRTQAAGRSWKLPLKYVLSITQGAVRCFFIGLCCPCLWALLRWFLFLYIPTAHCVFLFIRLPLSACQAHPYSVTAASYHLLFVIFALQIFFCFLFQNCNLINSIYEAW